MKIPVVKSAFWLSLMLSASCIVPITGAAQSKVSAVPSSSTDWNIPAKYRGKTIGSGKHNLAVKAVALTFDDGPSSNITPQILNILKQHHAHATFFVMGQNVKRYPQLVRQAVAEGHVIGCHTYTHALHPGLVLAQTEMAQTRQSVRQTIGRDPVLFRPPYGDTKSNYTRVARQQNDAIILWSVSGADTATRDANVVRDNVTQGIHSGDIVLMHDSSGKAQTARALPEILTRLEQQNFRFVTIPTMLRLSAAVPQLRTNAKFRTKLLYSRRVRKRYWGKIEA